MKLETFFEKFDKFADAPDAVAKMRELVLELAIHGGLVPRSPDEPPVPYESVEGATPINVTEVPSNWRVVLLADAIKNRSGNSKLIKGKLHEEPGPGRFQGFSASGADVWCDDYEHEGDAIIISAVGARCGKAFKASGQWSAIANTNIARPEPALFDFDFAYLVLNNEHFWVRGGSAQPFVKFPPSLDRHFAVPPLAEQKRIVAKVDEFMALCDRLEAQQQERETRHIALARASLSRFADAPTPANLQFLFHPAYTISPADLRKSILTLAVQGKLVEGDTAEEPADSLFAEMQKRREQLIDAKKIRKPRDLPSVTEDEQPFSVPYSWRWTRWGQICDWITYGFTRPMAHVEKGPPIVTAKNVQDGFMTFENAHRAEVSEFANLNPKDLPRKGDILITKDGTIGRAAVVETDEAFCINQSVAVLWLESCLLYRPFMLMVIRSPFAQGPIWEAAEGMAIKHLSITDFGRMIFPVPPLAEQGRIVAKVDQLMALIDQLETQLGASRATAAKLLEALVAGLTNQSTSFHPNGKIKSPDKIIPIRDDAAEDLLKVAEPTGKYGS
jgi:type I restriction enzyme, S subunit